MKNPSKKIKGKTVTNQKKSLVIKKTPAKKNVTKMKKATKKSLAKGRPKRKNKPSKKDPKMSIWRKLLGLSFKLLLVVIAVSVMVTIYFDQLVQKKFAGQLWQLPASVYSRTLTLKEGMLVNKSDIQHELDSLNYTKVRHPQRAGEYAASTHRINLYRRAFAFPDGDTKAKHVILSFSGQRLDKIYLADTGTRLNSVRIEPLMLGLLQTTDEEQRIFLPRESYPEVLISALLATEDQHFYQHDGVSPLGILRALVVNIRAGHTVQGGSTLTQQLAKNLFLTQQRTLWRKFKELYLALIIDHRYSKDRILEAYLNEVYLGQSRGKEVHGFALAAHLYFARPIQDLRIDQLAMLVGLVKGPGYYNPWRHPQRVKNRRNIVLKLLEQEHILTASQYKQLVSRDLDIQAIPKIASKQPAYFQQLRIELKRVLGDDFKPNKGWRIFTSLDPVSQERLEQAIKTTLPKLEKRVGKNLETAAVILDRKTGALRAMVGGADPAYAGFNRALNGKRQIGSQAKPSVYLTALSQPQLYDLATPLPDAPIALKSRDGQVWRPNNYDHKYRGVVPLYEGLAKSINIPTVNLGLQLGIDNERETLNKLGIPYEQIPQVPSIFLGSFTLAPYQVAQMFQVITNQGRMGSLSALSMVVDQDGLSLYEYQPSTTQVIPEQAAWLTTYAMKRVVTEGTARRLARRYAKFGLAGKTGTTNNNRDSWFTGVDGREVTTIWVGRDNNQPTGLTGSSGALHIYETYLGLRQPSVLRLPWPKGMTVQHYKKQGSRLEADDEGAITLPVWRP